MKSLSSLGTGLGYGARAARHKLAIVAVAAMATLPAQAQDATVTIAALGDSLTQGYGLPPEEGFVPQLANWLAANGHEGVEVLNAGVSGDTTAGGLSRIGWTLTDDVDGVIVALGGNDLLRGIDPANSRSNLEAILAEVTGRGLPVLLAGMIAPGNYGPEFKRDFDAMYPELADRYDAVYYPFFLQGLGMGTDPGAAADLMQPDGIHPNAEGVAAMVADIGPFVAELVERARD
ncbi:arylesterase [Halovulum dunhuangense]|uniref:Arylesterase n=1 Tax=Halovulum dunhuangense TaxID=1505036 RepID=A0A849L4P6_9RHOB|nr:arylesterase [Halovulum dunhuangense]NNU81408.1 arylesterase [Halovulum dunhuangense]